MLVTTWTLMLGTNINTGFQKDSSSINLWRMTSRLFAAIEFKNSQDAVMELSRYPPLPALWRRWHITDHAQPFMFLFLTILETRGSQTAIPLGVTSMSIGIPVLDRLSDNCLLSVSLTDHGCLAVWLSGVANPHMLVLKPSWIVPTFIRTAQDNL